MTPDERWYEAVKHLKKATELLDGKLTESLITDSKGNEHKEYRLLFSEEVLKPVQEEG